MTNTHHTTRSRPAGIPGAALPSLKHYIESHGFTAWRSANEIAFALPWMASTDWPERARGYMIVRVRSFAQARRELGY